MSANMHHHDNPINDIIDILDDDFSEDDLKRLCIELHLELDDYGGSGSGLRSRCIGLVDDMENKGRLDDLLREIEEVRPHRKPDLDIIRARLKEAATPPSFSLFNTLNINQIIIAVIVMLGLVAMVFIFLWSNNQSQKKSPPATNVAPVAEKIEPTIERDTPEPKPTDVVEPTKAIVETAVPDPTETTEPEPTATSEPTAVPTSVPTDTPTPTDTPIPTETPTPLIELGLLSTTNRDQDGQLMLYVPAGSFQMGASPLDNTAEGDEYPPHEVTLGAFWIDQTEITNQQYQICVDDGVCDPAASAGQLASADNYPRVNATWTDALTYCEWTGATLPTEAQWEFAARGTDGRIYPWGNDAPTCQKANYGGCINYPQPVESYPSGSSYSGTLDMSGNVYEWVSDWYSYNYYQNSPTNQPVNGITTNAKVRRGGSYFHSNNQIRATNRDSLPPTSSSSNTGFRCVVNITD